MADPFTAMIVMDVAMIGLQMAMAPHLKGPRLDDLNVSLADYGSVIPRIWGSRKIQPQIIWAEQLHEVKTTQKTKGGKYDQYKYYGTWAVLLCDQEIDEVAAIWFDKRKVFDRTRAGPISLAALFGNEGDSDSQKLSQGVNMRVYKGTETQNPDHRIVAWCEDRYGPDTTPAYRGSAYIVFQEIPLENSGNRIPQISVDVVRNKVNAFPFEQLNTDFSTEAAQFSPDFSKLIFHATFGFEVWDVASRTLIASSPLNVSAARIAVNADGSFYTGQYDGNVALISEGGAATVIGTGTMGGGVWNTDVGLYGTASLLSNQIKYVGGGAVTGLEVGFHPAWYFEDVDGQWWAVGGVATDIATYASGFGFFPLDATLLGTSQIVAESTSGPAYALDNGNGQFFVWQDDKIYLVNKDTFAVDAGPVDAPVNSSLSSPWESTRPGDTEIWLGFSKYSTQDLTVVQTINADDWAVSGGGLNAIYDRVNDAIWGRNITDTKVTIRYLNRISSDGVTLATIVDEVSGWVGLTGQDTSQLTQTVLGYSITQGSAKDILSPLFDIYDVDARPHDFIVQFVNRGSAPSGTLLTENFVRNDPRYTVTIQQDTDLPRRVTFNFADADKDQQQNTVIAQRPLDAVDSTREETIDLSTFVDTPSGAQQKADRYFRRLWNSRERSKLQLTAQQYALEPGDVTTVSLDGALRNVRLDKITIGQGTLDCEFVRDEISFSVLNGRAGPDQDGRDDDVIEVPGPTKGFIIDAPLIQDADNDVNPVLYVAAGSYGVTWTGASIYEGSDGTYDTLWGRIDSTGGAMWGYATSALVTANPNLWDRGNTLDVTVYGTLTSHTEAEIDADPTLNMIALGEDGRWEYLNFTTATLTGASGTANTYTLSGFKRGRRGTEGNVSNHAAGDQIILLNKAVATTTGTDSIGDALSFKIQTAGRSVDAAAAIDLTYDGDTLRPYAPARVKWTTDGADMFGEIIRRTRVGGSWNGGSTIPLSENSEAYEVDILDGADVLRTITVTGTNTFTYTGTEIAADGGTVGVPPSYNAYQMSDVAGRGFALAA
jgi:hypothetical protein